MIQSNIRGIFNHPKKLSHYTKIQPEKLILRIQDEIDCKDITCIVCTDIVKDF